MSSIQFLIGKTLGKYEVLEHIGHGGMSEVYKGQQAQLHRLVAIKVMHPFLADDEGFVVRFQREARIVATLRHPNIVQVYDFDYNDELELYYMVMEFIDGPTLKDRLLEGQLSTQETVYIGAAIADALDYAHQHGMVHRDIKPANILFIDNREPVLTDFGIARMMTLSGLTASGAMVGTPAYMAPEIGKGKAGTSSSDIYSLSVLLYQTLTGSLPFSAESPMGMVLEHVNTPAPSPKLLKDEIPGALAAAILRGLEKEPEARFATAGDMAAALRVSLTAAETTEELAAGKPGAQEPGAETPGAEAAPAGAGDTPGRGQPGVEMLVTPSRVPPASPLDEDAEESEAEAEMLRQARLVKSWNPLSHRTVLPEDAEGRPQPISSPPSWWLTGSLLGIALLTIVGGLWLATTGRSTATPGAQTPTGAVGTQMLRTPVPTGATPTGPPTVTPERTVGAPVAPTPTLNCALRVRQERVHIDPAAVVPPGTALTARIAVRNSGNCPWPDATGLVRTGGTALGAPDVLTATALAPGASIQWVLALLAPEDIGVYTSTWEMRAADGTRFGSRILVGIEVADVTPAPPTPTIEVDLGLTTPEPLTLEEVSILTWEDDRNRGTWSGTARILATGGSGQYYFFLERILPDNELVDGVFTFEARICEPVALDLVILSGADQLDWQGEIAYPAPETCQ